MGTFLRLLRICGIASAALGGLLSSPAFAATGTGRGEAVVVSRLSFFSVEDLEFGTILAGPTAGTVTVAPDGTRTALSGATLAGGLPQAARFAGRGTFGQFVTISMVATPITITRVGGTETMQVGTFMIGSSPSTTILTTAPRTFQIGSATGIFNFPVGATLSVGANQRDGDYQGTFSITLNYN